MDTEGIEFAKDYLVIRQKPLILKLRSLGAGVEEADETRITYLEAAYFAERKVLPLDNGDLLSRALETDPLAREKYHVIRYLRERGYIVRPSLDGTPYLRLHRKGLRPGEDKTYYLIEAVPKGWRAGAESLIPSIEAAGRLRKELAIAIVDLAQEKPLFLKFGRMNFE
jgi:tRNA splicing endonuclease